MHIFKFLLFVLVALLLPDFATAQTARATNDIILRVLRVNAATESGSIFSADVDRREYWITAKHILTGAKHPPFGSITAESIDLKILDPGSQTERWLPIRFRVIDPGSDVDIVVLAPPASLLPKSPLNPILSNVGAPIGGECEFLGYAFGKAWRATFDTGESFWMPFIKHCTISGFTKEPQRVWILDGNNNEGFSGGPVIFNTGTDMRVMGVISSYVTQPANVVQTATPTPVPLRGTEPHPDEHVDVNTGFILAYDIQYAIDAIKKNPIGPLTSTRK